MAAGTGLQEPAQFAEAEHFFNNFSLKLVNSDLSGPLYRSLAEPPENKNAVDIHY